ncbi:hypothetical protein A2U01_0078963, partial [Trifolium medium]|nr:hypothetical protein [Trifolium medium]
RAMMKSAEFGCVCPRVFPDFSRRTDPGFGELGVGTLL